MKKILVVVMFMSAVSAFAEKTVAYNAFCKLGDKTVSSQVLKYVDANKEQIAFLEHVFSVTGEEMKIAVMKRSEETAQNIMKYNLYNAKCMLTEEQYRKYLVFLNVYLENGSTGELYADR
ncbi:MAG TPA: hypothetical protein VK152_11800 [Paludibacter sp.]|nr:hypothetical protein [Paludibacter sp.]